MTDENFSLERWRMLKCECAGIPVKLEDRLTDAGKLITLQILLDKGAKVP